MPQNFERKNIVPFRWIISKKYCVISVVDVGEMEVANINSKTTRTVSREPINCTAKKRRNKYTRASIQEQVYNLMNRKVKFLKQTVFLSEQCAASKATKMFEIQPFGLVTGSQSFCHSFIA